MAKYYVDVAKLITTWYKDEQMTIVHREDGPAVEYIGGDKHWYKDGKLHRDGGPAVEWHIGYTAWYKDGKLHREDGPAQEYPSGDKSWQIDGKLHREDGPAVEFVTLNKVEYWLNDQQLTKEQWEDAVRPAEEMTVAQIEQLLGKRIKIIK